MNFQANISYSPVIVLNNQYQASFNEQEDFYKDKFFNKSQKSSKNNSKIDPQEINRFLDEEYDKVSDLMLTPCNANTRASSVQRGNGRRESVGIPLPSDLNFQSQIGRNYRQMNVQTKNRMSMLSPTGYNSDMTASIEQQQQIINSKDGKSPSLKMNNFFQIETPKQHSKNLKQKRFSQQVQIKKAAF
eukprot:403366393